MPIPNSVQFLDNAGVNIPGSLNDIVDAIIAYHRSAGPNKVEELYVLYKEIEHWQKKHKPGMFTDRTRENAVWGLRSDVFTELDAQVAGLGTALVDYGIRKKGGERGSKFTGLQPGYSRERTTYMVGGKQQAPYSGTMVHSHKDAQGRFDSLSGPEFDAIGLKTKVRMYWLNKIQRLQFVARCTNTGWQDIAGQPMHTTMAHPEWGIGYENECQMFAMDRYGNLFVGNDNQRHGQYTLGLATNQMKGARLDRGQTNHSSFCAGREVICAGTIFFWKGQLIHIDNNSGHYAPKRNALYQAVKILAGDGTNIDYLRVLLFGVGCFTARSFLANSGRPDWPTQDMKAAQNGDFTARGVQL